MNDATHAPHAPFRLTDGIVCVYERKQAYLLREPRAGAQPCPCSARMRLLSPHAARMPPACCPYAPPATT